MVVWLVVWIWGEHWGRRWLSLGSSRCISHPDGYTTLEEYRHGFLGLGIKVITRASSRFHGAEATSGCIDPLLTFHAETDSTEREIALHDVSCFFLSIELDKGESIHTVCYLGLAIIFLQSNPLTKLTIDRRLTYNLNLVDAAKLPEDLSQLLLIRIGW